MGSLKHQVVTKMVEQQTTMAMLAMTLTNLRKVAETMTTLVTLMKREMRQLNRQKSRSRLRHLQCLMHRQDL